MTWAMIVAFLFEYRFVIAVGLAVILYAFFEWNKFKSLAYAIMLNAKSKAKDLILKSGQEQEDFVVQHLYALLPLRIKAFIKSPETLRPVVHFLYLKMKDLIDDGSLNGSITE
jgi:hypothetical protein